MEHLAPAPIPHLIPQSQGWYAEQVYGEDLVLQIAKERSLCDAPATNASPVGLAAETERPRPTRAHVSCCVNQMGGARLANGNVAARGLRAVHLFEIHEVAGNVSDGDRHRPIDFARLGHGRATEALC